MDNRILGLLRSTSVILGAEPDGPPAKGNRKAHQSHPFDFRSNMKNSTFQQYDGTMK
jgi:hypothetical protein